MRVRSATLFISVWVLVSLASTLAHGVTCFDALQARNPDLALEINMYLNENKKLDLASAFRVISMSINDDEVREKFESRSEKFMSRFEVIELTGLSSGFRKERLDLKSSRIFWKPKSIRSIEELFARLFKIIKFLSMSEIERFSSIRVFSPGFRQQLVDQTLISTEELFDVEAELIAQFDIESEDISRWFDPVISFGRWYQWINRSILASRNQENWTISDLRPTVGRRRGSARHQIATNIQWLLKHFTNLRNTAIVSLGLFVLPGIAQSAGHQIELNSYGLEDLTKDEIRSSRDFIRSSEQDLLVELGKSIEELREDSSISEGEREFLESLSTHLSLENENPQ